MDASFTSQPYFTNEALSSQELLTRPRNSMRYITLRNRLSALAASSALQLMVWVSLCECTTFPLWMPGFCSLRSWFAWSPNFLWSHEEDASRGRCWIPGSGLVWVSSCQHPGAVVCTGTGERKAALVRGDPAASRIPAGSIQSAPLGMKVWKGFGIFSLFVWRYFIPKQ